MATSQRPNREKHSIFKFSLINVFSSLSPFKIEVPDDIHRQINLWLKLIIQNDYNYISACIRGIQSSQDEK